MKSLAGTGSFRGPDSCSGGSDTRISKSVVVTGVFLLFPYFI